MKFSTNSSYVNRIIDSLSNNRVTDFATEGASPMLRKTFGGASNSFMNSFKLKQGRNTHTSLQPNKRSLGTAQTLDNSTSNPQGHSTNSKLNPLRMSLPSRPDASMFSGRDIRPDLHQKTYFKATTSVYIQNSPKASVPRSTSTFAKMKTQPLHVNVKNLNSLPSKESMKEARHITTKQVEPLSGLFTSQPFSSLTIQSSGNFGDMPRIEKAKFQGIGKPHSIIKLNKLGGNTDIAPNEIRTR